MTDKKMGVRFGFTLGLRRERLVVFFLLGLDVGLNAINTMAIIVFLSPFFDTSRDLLDAVVC